MRSMIFFAKGILIAFAFVMGLSGCTKKSDKASEPSQIGDDSTENSGQFDTTFATSGFTLTNGTPVQGYLSTQGKGALQSDGKIVRAGFIQDNFGSKFVFLMRRTGAGVLDSSFGAGGVVLTQLDQNVEIEALQVLANGKILIGGSFSGNHPTLLRAL